MSEFPIALDRWVGGNNPSEKLSFRKGWWDYIEIARRLAHKFNVEQVEVVGTYAMIAPSLDEEVLLMPVVRFTLPSAVFCFKYDFGTYPEMWVVSVSGSVESYCQGVGLFAEPVNPRGTALSGIPECSIFGALSGNHGSFTCEVGDELDLSALIRLVLCRHG